MKSLNLWDDDKIIDEIDKNENGMSNNKNYMVRLQSYTDLDLVPQEFHREFYYSKFLELIIKLTKQIFSDKGNWRVQEQYLYNLGSEIHRFNAVEMLDLMGYKVIEIMKNGGTDQVKNSASYFVA